MPRQGAPKNEAQNEAQSHTGFARLGAATPGVDPPRFARGAPQPQKAAAMGPRGDPDLRNLVAWALIAGIIWEVTTLLGTWLRSMEYIAKAVFRW